MFFIFWCAPAATRFKVKVDYRFEPAMDFEPQYKELCLVMSHDDHMMMPCHIIPR